MQKATLEASGHSHDLSILLSQNIAVYSIYSDKQAALRAHAQTPAGWGRGMRVGARAACQ